MQRAQSRPRLERHMATIFDDSAFADLSLDVIHPTHPFSMRFEVHKNIVSQSPFFHKILNNVNELHSHTTIYVYDKDSDKNSDTEANPLQKVESKVLKIDLAGALLRCGFVLTPFQLIIRRKWQRPEVPSPSLSIPSQVPTETAEETEQQPSGGTVKPLANYILSSHIRFALRWMYAYDRQELVQTLEDQDTLRVLVMAILFGLDDLATSCVEKYIEQQLSMETIIRDLEHISQLPRSHHAYLQLRDAALLLLLRHGPDEPEVLSELPVDYMADVLNADMLFVGCEYDRYCLIREVLSLFMRSVGEITWTKNGPVDQDRKRLSGFVKPKPITAVDIRSRKRKRIPSNEFASDYTSPHRASKLARLSFSATVPFKSLAEDASSGGIIDKATVLSHLLKTTIDYSNMTLDQLTKVHRDGIVDDEIVFRALWQQKQFEQLLLPAMRGYSYDDDIDEEDSDERHAALNDFFDVSDSDDYRRQILLGTAKYRFCMTITLSPPCTENGWIRDENVSSSRADDDDDDSPGNPVNEGHSPPKELLAEQHGNVDEPEENQGKEEIVNLEDDDEIGDHKVGELVVGSPPPTELPKQASFSRTLSDNDDNNPDTHDEQSHDVHDNNSAPQAHRYGKHIYQDVIWRKTFYSQPEVIWGTTYRIQIEAQVIPHHLLVIQDDDDDSDTNGSNISRVVNDDSQRDTHKDSRVLVCRFELQRAQLGSNNNFSVMSAAHHHQNRIPALSRQPTAGMPSSQPTTPASKVALVPSSATQPSTLRRRCSAPSQFTSTTIPKQPRIRYTIHCLNRREGLIENHRVDPEDRMLVAVTDMSEGEDNSQTGYVGQVQLDGYDLREHIKVDTVVCLDVFGFNKYVQ